MLRIYQKFRIIPPPISQISRNIKQQKKQVFNLDITQFSCANCQQFFTKLDNQQNNWILWRNKKAKVNVNYDKEIGYVIVIEIKKIAHQFCPNFAKTKRLVRKEVNYA